jgi:hypothetical protein
MERARLISQANVGMLVLLLVWAIGTFVIFVILKEYYIQYIQYIQ